MSEIVETRVTLCADADRPHWARRFRARATRPGFGRVSIVGLLLALLLTVFGSQAALAQVADLAMTKTVSDPTPNVGDVVSFTVTLSNAGPDAATNVSVQDLLPAGLTFVSAAPSQGTYASGSGIWDVGSVAAGAPATLQLVATVAGAAAQTNTASIAASDQSDPNGGNNSASATVTPQTADLSLTHTVSNPSPIVGDVVTFTVTLGNAGPNVATNVSVQDLLPAGLTFVSATPSQGTYSDLTGIWTVGTVTPGAPQTLALQATVTTTNPTTNTATISQSDQFDPATGNNAAGATVTAHNVNADLSVTKSAPATIQPGQNITYTITVSNAGPEPAATVTVNDTLPAGLTFVSATPSQGTFAAGVWTVGTVVTGTPQTLTLTATVNGALAVGTVLTNVATVASATPDLNAGNNSASVSTTVTTSAATTTALTSSLNPVAFAQAVTFTATVSAGGATGNVTFRDGATVLATVALGGAATATFTTSSLAVGAHAITATYNGDVNFLASTSPVLTQSVGTAATAAALASSLNPSEFGKPVTFTATVTSSAGTPTGTVIFSDGGVAIGTATLAAGIASLTTSTLTVGSHTITASYGGAATFGPATSPALSQTVNTPADSVKLRALQVLVTPIVAQVSGQAISGAVDSAIGEAFSGGGAFISPSASGVRFNFAADPDAQPANGSLRSTDPFTGAGGTLANNGRSSQPGQPARIEDAFNAIGYAPSTKAPPLRVAEPKEWLGWAEVRGATLDRWGSSSAVPGATVVYGNQMNLLAGLTRRFTPNFVAGVLGGYETFDYRSDALSGRLKGDGWTVGSYLGWKITQGIRFDAGVAYSGIGFDGTAGTAAGSFTGQRWLVTSGLTGTYSSYGFQIEPSARVYALWEHENAYTDTLGTLQAARDFSTGRASAGTKLAYPVAWSGATVLTPYVGLYGDYYFKSDSVALVTPGALPFVVLDGWSARAVGGVTARFDNGAQLAIGGERSGLGGSFGLWTYRARASLPFGAR
ncbi:DUF11 domain-containing protein [Bradyrhizobium sp. AUGA SZCCT0240]|uniref:Ig-like domain repeat protein n=1 Tax=unclassified Bradyrhizobium TaxID=2631580 RepID=UPI001BA9BCE8|nr:MULTISPECIES: Ig-like domain repeat protein [unclassified Bradyrhizobium]MBR1194803.1 DUF11 domain-containing protein [Bradyrhizobium sp. AUGA SZCCT0158]MBR1239181.1 DUF11 domain-containing protein [Bradyrhizobium sp. AUGA SZCCT0274]MBR1254163.1 DUF11 domain-containing protein [Bradyrhizobium sp. AUGA SZCCT0240]